LGISNQISPSQIFFLNSEAKISGQKLSHQFFFKKNLRPTTPMDKNIFSTISEKFSEEGTPSQVKFRDGTRPSSSHRRRDWSQREQSNKINPLIYSDDNFIVQPPYTKDPYVADGLMATYCEIQSKLRVKNNSLLGNIFNPNCTEHMSTLIAIDELLIRCQNLEERIEDQNGMIALGKKECSLLQEEYERFDLIRDSMLKDKEILAQKNFDAEDQIFN
jgi:hypothetical protein